MSKPRWRDHYAIHPAAAFYHGFSCEEQLGELTEDIERRQVIFDPIHTASVLGKTFVIDGISRLDAAEKTGRQIVDENGNWIGMLDGHRVYHSSKTDEEVWDIVSSLNLKRRHLSKEQIVEVADHMLKLEAAENSAAKKELASTARSFSPNRGKRGGSTKDPHKTALYERAEKMAGEPISKRTVEKYLSRQPDRPKKVPSERKLKTKTKPKKEKPFEAQVWEKWSRLIQGFSLHERQQVKAILREFSAIMLKDWPWTQSQKEVEIIRRFMAFMFRNWPYGKQSREALEIIHGYGKGTKQGEDNREPNPSQ